MAAGDDKAHGGRRVAQRYLDLWEDQIDAAVSEPRWASVPRALAMPVVAAAADPAEGGFQATPRRARQTAWRAPPVGDRDTSPSPPPRHLAPRPLGLHLALAMCTAMSGLGALPAARLGTLPWHPRLAVRAAEISAELAATSGESLAAASGEAILERLQDMLSGIEAYRRHPYRRRLPDPPTIWQEGTTRLLDYGALGGAADANRAPPVLFVPSLVNRGYVLDLSPRRSLLRALAGRGLRPVLVDWGSPGAAERGFTLTDYVAGRLERALTAAQAGGSGPAALVGYCMGGNLALALALRRPRDIRCLALLATPWDFHADRKAQAERVSALAAALEPVLAVHGELPVDLLQSLFAALDPNLASRKFRAFGALAPDSDAAADFVALEDWLNDGIPLSGPVARECLVGWYGENAPAAGTWRIAGRAVQPRRLGVPSLVVLPSRDRIVPPASARALADTLPGATTFAPGSGHIGMVVGGGAESGLWTPLYEWLRAHMDAATSGQRRAME